MIALIDWDEICNGIGWYRMRFWVWDGMRFQNPWDGMRFLKFGMGRDLMMFFKFRMGWYGIRFLVWIGCVWDHPEWKTIYFEWDRMGWSYSTSPLVCNIGMSSYHRIRRTLVDAAYFLNLSRGRIHYWSWYNRGIQAPLVICYSRKILTCYLLFGKKNNLLFVI